MAKGESLADQLFNRDTVGQLAAQFDGAFDTDAFVRDVIVDLHDLELKARINHIAVILAGYLPQDFEVAAKVIHNALPAPLNPDLTDDDSDLLSMRHWVFSSKNRGLRTMFQPV